MAGKQIPEKCRLCAKLTAAQALQLHGIDGDGCWDSSVCPSRRSHARHHDRRNFARNLKRWQKQGQVAISLTDLEIAPIQEPPINSEGRSRIQFETNLPNFNYSAVLQVYRRSVDAPLHAVGGEIWYGTQKTADIAPIHCTKLTARQVEIYLERLLYKLTEVYGIRKFTTKEELHPQCCPLSGCQERE
ncbi:MAG: hypothetical protein KME05_08170 [Gloeocapsa sp. UFS-A4-WI-NPMV-4B04]|jgi:hypothetical protein|nr:hypothetical protein [Gloeocapsa sp. UFS-A4-WI-NPMV-4B04]